MAPRAGNARFGLVGKAAAFALALSAFWLGGARADVLRACEPATELNATQQDVLFRVAATIKDRLTQSGQDVALIARSGLDLQRFGVRYSHAGISLKASPNGPWSVRQLYYACDEGKPKIYDQGMSGFTLGAHDAKVGYFSIVFMPSAESNALAAAALDGELALRLLATTYSANAYPFSTLYQNCNQWLVELMAWAWGGRGDSPAVSSPETARTAAQHWLQAQGYQGTPFNLSRPLMWASHLMKWFTHEDHPSRDLTDLRFWVSMPASIERFVQQRLPGATRLEVCYTAEHMVLHQGWDEVGEGCVAGVGDEVIALR